MRFDDTKSTIIKNCSSFHKSIRWFTSKKEIYFSISWLCRICTVCCVFSTISSKQSSQWTGSFSLCFLSISWTNQASPFLNCLWASETHSDNNITLHMTTKIWEKWFTNMLSVECLNRLIVEFWHFQFIDFKSIFVNCINDFSKISISIRFYHSVSTSTVLLLFISCCGITIFGNMQYSCEYGNFCTDVEIWKFKIWCFDSF